jgi:hypothetical protein
VYEKTQLPDDGSIVESCLLLVLLDRVAVRARHRLRTVTVVPGETSHHDRLRRGARTPTTRRPAERGVEGEPDEEGRRGGAAEWQGEWL